LDERKREGWGRVDFLGMLILAARHDRAGFLAGLDGPVIIDEVQKAPNLCAERGCWF
jgi:hypothetical protein